ncbi:alpha-1,6-mannosyl-glycoprotein 2-beta-N-acetylglucosaminyltransferase-like isoform X2 [Physella acuta]|uniref:alpha-1,6-mannosyl-glycoprotein 2-beta-N-acetylglucosaminyltransferase-like isoform X2 n=1 Tax=Physella acuta TaxID=109671 RepID=UPI0027DDDD25|nr:alpha-1,6-mannosyl-glycoprotein 2-beta-N-acetylglucosaminyltransferase-like isoform X2 [Physella acuta]
MQLLGQAEPGIGLSSCSPWCGAVMRLSLRRSLRFFLVTTMVVFVMLNLHVLYNTPRAKSSEERAKSLHQSTGSEFHVQLSSDHTSSTSKHSVVIAPRVMNETNSTVNNQLRYHRNISMNDSDALKLEVIRINTEQYVHNLDKFGIDLGPNSLVIVIQTHDRPDYLKILLDSMRKVKDIEKSLLIVSHDVYSQQLNDLIESVDFCPVMQIFFPYAQQIYKNEFPGEHPNDCPRNVKKEEAVALKCNNAEHPDKYGHYREAKYCQAKHHWIWKLHHLFEDLVLMKNYEGNVMLLEDDYYLSEDIIFSTHMLRGLRERECPDCRMLVLGNYDKNQNYDSNGAKAERAFWVSSKHNMGMTFNRSVWLEIKKCINEFCTFDDYNWDWTLQHLSMKCIPDKIKLLVMKASRIFHVGECGMHKKSSNCYPDNVVKQVETKLAENHKHLFPNAVSIAGDSRFKLRDPKPNGGWGDIRDHNLCLHYFNSTSLR